jgi:hypothetical protein
LTALAEGTSILLAAATVPEVGSASLPCICYWLTTIDSPNSLHCALPHRFAIQPVPLTTSKTHTAHSDVPVGEQQLHVRDSRSVTALQPAICQLHLHGAVCGTRTLGAVYAAPVDSLTHSCTRAYSCMMYDTMRYLLWRYRRTR